MASAPPTWLLSRDESIGQKFEQIMNKDPLGSQVRPRPQQVLDAN
jgi:hypothetical protein